MSYFYSNAGGGGGSGNKQIRYSVIIDTAQLESQLRSLGLNLKTAFESGNTSIAGLGTGIQNVGTQMTTTAAKANTFTGALQQFNTTAATSSTGMNTFTTGLGTFNTGVQSSNTQLNTFTGALRTFDTSTKTVTTSVGGTSSSISILSDDFNKLATGGLNETNTLAGKTVGGFDSLEKQTGKTTGTLGKLREGFAGNRGLVYSMGTIFGTITGVVAEMQLLDDAHAQVAEATAKLTKLEAEGQKGTSEYTQALQQKEKAERFSSFTTRNLALATANFVPELLLLATNLSKNEGIGKKLSGVFSKLKGESNTLSGAMKSAGAAGATGAIGVNAFAAGMARVAAPIAAIAAIILGAIISIQRIGDMFKLSSGDINKQREALDDWFNGWRKVPIIGPLLASILDPLGLIPEVTLGAVDATDKLADSIGGIGDGVGTASSGIKSLVTTVASYIPTSKLFEQSWRTVIKDGHQVDESYLRVAKSINYYGLQQQTSAATSKIATEGFKNLAAGITTTNTVIAPNTALLKKSGIALLDIGKATTAAGTTTVNTTNAFSKWISTGVEPAKKAIEELRGGVMAGTISEQDLSKAVDLTIDPLIETGKLSESAGAAAKKLAVETLTHLIPGLKKTGETLMTDLEIWQEYDEELKKGHELIKQRADEVADLVHTEELLNKVGITRQDIMSHDVGTYEKLTKVSEDVNEAYKAEEESLTKVLVLHGKSNLELNKLVDTEGDQTDQLRDAVIQSNLWTDALDGVVNGVDLVKKATADAVITMADWVQNAVEAEAKTKAMNEMYAELGRGMVDNLHTTVPLTTKDFIELGKTWKDGVPLAEKLAKIVDEDLSPAFETFSDVIQAATRKDFKEAWKGLEFGDVGKRFKGELKDILEGMNDIARSGKAVATVVSGLVVGALRGMSDKALGQGIKEIVEQFNRFKSLDPDAKIVQPLINWVNNLPPASRAAGIIAIHGGLEDMATAQKEGNLTQEKAMAIMGRYQPMINAYNKAIAEGATPAQALAKAQGEIGTNADTAAPKLDSVAAALNSVNLAAQDVGDRMSKLDFEFAPPKLDLVAETLKSVNLAVADVVKKTSTAKYNLAAPNIQPATNAFKSVEVNWRGYANKIKSIVPNITVNNKQALDAISKVVSAMNNIKNVSRTITITTVYKTQGSPATSTRTSTRTGITAGAGAHTSTREGISTVTPFMPSETTNLVAPTAGAGKDINIQIHMRDEFGIEKIRKYKAAMGGNRFVFGTVGAGG